MHHDIQLTKKGEVYAQLNSAHPSGCPSGIDPREWRKALESRVELHLSIVTSLLALLDDGDDPDLEPVCEDEGAEHDGREPALGWTDMEARYSLYGYGVDDEQEEDDPAGGDILDEPHDEASTADLEPDEPSWLYPNGAHLPGGGSGI